MKKNIDGILCVYFSFIRLNLSRYGRITIRYVITVTNCISTELEKTEGVKQTSILPI